MAHFQNLVPIKVKICLGADGMHAFPPFNQLPSALRREMDWSKFLDAHGLGWHNDKLSGHGFSDEHDDAVPNGHEHENHDPSCWYVATCVPKLFADAAVTKWPDLVSKLSEASWASFYDDRAHAHEETQHLDVQELQGLLARIQLEALEVAPPPSEEILALRKRMLDPNDQKRGIRKSKTRKWADAKKAKGVTIYPS